MVSEFMLLNVCYVCEDSKFSYHFASPGVPVVVLRAALFPLPRGPVSQQDEVASFIVV